MPKTGSTPHSPQQPTPAVYSPRARHYHWLTVALIAMQVPVGVYMSYRGNKLDIWDGLTNGLYSWHKLIGLIIFGVVLARLAYRLSHGAPPDEPTLEPWQKLASHVTHWALYGLLIVVPIIGFLGISYYPALDIFGFKLPGLVTPNEDTAKAVFEWHERGAFLLVLLVFLHIGAALFHGMIRKDGVLRRMLPGRD